MRQPMRPNRRAALAAASVLSLVAALLWTTQPSAHAEVTYAPGSGLAETAPFGVNVVYNNANIGLVVAQSNAGFASTSAKATATPFGFGLANLVAAITLCGEHPIPSGLMPAALIANSDEGNGQPVERYAGDTQGFALGSAHVRAASGADAQADTLAFALDLAGIAAVSGGESHTRATSDAVTHTRRVTADTVADLSLLSGLIHLDGMSFHLEQTSVGEDARTSERMVASDVAFGTFTLAGVPIPLPDDPSAATAQLNNLLGPLGLQVLAPQLVADGQFGHRLAPMTFRLGGQSAYTDLVAQLAGNAQIIGLQDQLQKGLFDTQNCDQLAGLLQPLPQINALYNAIGIAAPILAAVIISALAGGGSIDIQVGGARTRIDDTLYTAPTFSRAGSAAGADPAAALGPAPAAPGASASPAPAALAAPGPLPAAATKTICATTSPASRPGCWSGLAPVGAVAAFLLFGGLLATDEVRRRRLSRLDPMES